MPPPAAGERVVTVEDAAELRLPGDHVVRLEARPANADGLGAVGVRDLVRAALRMRPDRIVVGEVRGAEALDMLQAMNTGHDGSLSTVPRQRPGRRPAPHRDHGADGLIALPLAAVREQILGAVDLVVQVARGSTRLPAGWPRWPRSSPARTARSPPGRWRSGAAAWATPPARPVGRSASAWADRDRRRWSTADPPDDRARRRGHDAARMARGRPPCPQWPPGRSTRLVEVAACPVPARRHGACGAGG